MMFETIPVSRDSLPASQRRPFKKREHDSWITEPIKGFATTLQRYAQGFWL
jgi:hypothetical protein